MREWQVATFCCASLYKCLTELLSVCHLSKMKAFSA